MAITYQDTKVLHNVLEQLQSNYSKIDIQSKCFHFDQSDYYEEEMGANLKKQFFSFDNLDRSEQLVERKLRAMEVEKRFAIENKRRLNIDPAYMELAKLVVASTKNFDHRIHLEKGIYGDLQFRYRGGKFVPNDWTYPDYKTEITMEFLNNVRTIYFQQLKDVKNHLQ